MQRSIDSRLSSVHQHGEHQRPRRSEGVDGIPHSGLIRNFDLSAIAHRVRRQVGAHGPEADDPNFHAA